MCVCVVGWFYNMLPLVSYFMMNPVFKTIIRFH